MKKVTALLLAIVATAALAVVMVGCSGGASSAAPEPTPSNAVSGMLDAIKAKDTAGVAKYYAGEISEDADLNAELEKNEQFAALPDDQKALVKSMVDKVLDFDYAVGNEKIDGDKATVDVTFTTYDFGSSVETLMGTIMTMAMSAQAGGDTSEEAGEAAAIEAFQKTLDGLTTKDVSSTVTVNVSKDADGNWKVDDLSTLPEDEAKKLGDALLGGLVTKLEGLMQSFGSSLDMNALGDMAGQATTDKAA